MNSLSFPLRLLAAMTAAALFLGRASAEENTSTIKFSDPGKPGTLKVSVARGDIRIQGGTAPEVVVKSEAPPHQRARKDGLRVLTESASYTLSEKDNVVTLDAASDGWVGTSSDFAITVPRGTNVVIASALGGDITCANVTGDLEIKSLHGRVRLENLVGGALVETLNGEISGTIRELHEGKALSFTSMNGQVVLRVPPTLKANVRLRTQNGTILTDFDEKALVTKVEATTGARRHGMVALTPEMREAFREAGRAAKVATEQAANALREAAEAAREGVSGDKADASPAVPPAAPAVPLLPAIPTVTGGKLVTGTLNGGGPEISVTTMNGDVTLRQSEGK